MGGLKIILCANYVVIVLILLLENNLLSSAVEINNQNCNYRDYYADQNVNCSQFLTIWSPKKFYKGKSYNIAIFSTQSHENTEIALEFGGNIATVQLTSETLQNISIKNNFRSVVEKEHDLVMTLHRNTTYSWRSRRLCLTKNLGKIEVEVKDFFIFFQMSKPIYKPGDAVKVLIFLVDRDLKPYYAHNVKVKIFDDQDRQEYEFDDPEETFLGVYSLSFELRKFVALGKHHIRVIVDNFEAETVKTFTVEKYAFPAFNVLISTNSSILSAKSILKISFYAKYSSGKFVQGDATLIIQDPKNGTEYFSKNFSNVQETLSREYRINEILRTITTTKTELEVKIIFRDTSNSISVTKSTLLTVQANIIRTIKPKHSKTFIPGKNFTIKAMIFDERNKKILRSYEKVGIIVKYVFQNGNGLIKSIDYPIVDDQIVANYEVPIETEQMSIQIEYPNSQTYQKRILKKDFVELSSLNIKHSPKLPKINDNVKISVSSNSELDQIIAIVVGKFGPIYSLQIDCDYENICDFAIWISKEMAPQLSVKVYYMDDIRSIDSAETIIKIQAADDNMINIGIPSSTKPKSSVTFETQTKQDSAIFLVAFDKRLKYFNEKYSTNNEEDINEFRDFDSTLNINIVEMTDWHDCTEDELERIANGKELNNFNYYDDYDDYYDKKYIDEYAQELMTKFGGKRYSNMHKRNTEFDQLDQLDDDYDDDSVNLQIEDSKTIYEYFPESWMLKDYLQTESHLQKSFPVPDTIASWEIHAVSMNYKYGLAIAPQKEILSSDNFFIEIVTPYSVRCREIFEVDILVNNYIDYGKTLNVTVELSNQFIDFEFIEYTGCTQSNRSLEKLSKTVVVNSYSTRKVSFNIRSKTCEFDKKLLIQVSAIGRSQNNEIFEYEVRKWLKVDVVTIKIFYYLKKYELENVSSQSAKIPKILSLDRIDEDENYIFNITADGVSSMIDLKLRFEINSSQNLEDKTKLIKGNVEYYRYLKSLNKIPPTAYFSDQYESLLKQRITNWNSGSGVGLRAYFIEAIASALEVNAVNKTAVIEKELDAIKSSQTSSGTFVNFGSYPQYTGAGNSDKYYQTAFTLIPFLRLRKYVKKDYSDVINKCFKYLDSSSSRFGVDEDVFSIAAFAYALNNNSNKSIELLNLAENYSNKIGNDQRCLRYSSKHSSCGVEHTSYAALAYAKMGKVRNAEPLINWLLKTHDMNNNVQSSHQYSIAVEAIAKFVTDITITIRNEHKYLKTVHITQENVRKSIEIELPDYSRSANVQFEGTGFFFFETIKEHNVYVPVKRPSFDLSVKPRKSYTSNEKIIEVCSTYKVRDVLIDDNVIEKVFLDVDFPNGYIFKDLNHKNGTIKEYTQHSKNSKVKLHYSNVEVNKTYCVDITVKQVFRSLEISSAAVLLYDYNSKESLTVEYYNFSPLCI